MSNPGMQLTSAGRTLLAKALLGNELKFSKVAYGSGNFDYATEKVSNLTELRLWRMDLPIVNSVITGDGLAEIHARLNNFDLEQGFPAKEIGVFAFDPDTGDEILYAYRNAGDEYTFIPANTGPVHKNSIFAYRVEIQDAPNVTCVYDFDFAYTSQQEFDDHKADSQPHPNSPTHYADISTADSFWATSDDNHLHKLSLANAKNILLPEIEGFLKLQKIIQQDLENYRVFKRLGIDTDLIFDDCLDLSAVTVTSCAKYSELVGVEGLDDLVIGYSYILTDGVNFESVKVVGLGFGSGSCYARLSTGLANDYDLTCAKLYRTVQVSAAVQDISWQTKTFEGVNAGDSRIIYNL